MIVVGIAAVAGVAGEARFLVEPFRLYRSETARDIRFYDGEGRPLFFGHYPNARLATSPAGAVSANVKLEEVPVPKLYGPEFPIDTPSFWQERSLVVSNGGDRVEIRPCGYAVSIPVPITMDLRFTADAKEPRRGCPHRMPQRIWLDADMREIGGNYLMQGNYAPTNAAFTRYTISHSIHNQGFRLACSRKAQPAYSSVAHPGEIVLAPGCDIRERWAAVQLVRWTKCITGRTLAIVTEPTKGVSPRVFLGRRWAEGRYDDELKQIAGRDGYAIRRKGTDVFAFGALGRGTIYAAAALLEDVADFVWWRPNAYCGVNFRACDAVPFAAAKDALSSPAFPRRTWATGGGNQDDYNDWVAWNFTTRLYQPRDPFLATDYRCKERGHLGQIGDSFLRLPLSVEKRDDFYPVVSGKRMVGTPVGQPCFSNPDVMKATRAGVRKVFEHTPEEYELFCYDYSDSWLCCECENCMKPIRLPQGGELKATAVRPQDDPFFRSTRTYMAANEVADEVRRLKPGLDVLMLAYIYTAANPSVKLDDSIRLIFATYDTCSMRFPTLAQTKGTLYAPESWATRFRRWLDREPQAIGMYEYFFTASPAMLSEAAAANMAEMAKAGGRHVHSQSQTDDHWKAAESFGRNEQMWDANAMDQWMVSRLMWDPFQDVNALRRRFLERVYGRKAAATLAEAYALFGKAWFDPGYKAWFNCHTAAPDAYVKFIVRPGIEKRFCEILDAALAACDNACGRKQLARMIATYRDFKAATGREDVPFVPELAGEWQDAGSPQWNRAFEVPAFREALATNKAPERASAVTKVLFACDARYLYFNVASDMRKGSRERIELRFRPDPRSDREFFLCADGTHEDASGFDPTWESGWQTNGRTGRIPMAAIRATPTNTISYVCLRTDARGVLSYGRSATNVKNVYPGTSVDSFSTLVPEKDSVFDLPGPKGSAQPGAVMKERSAAAFAVEGGKAYRLDFCAAADRTYLPDDFDLLSEAAGKCPRQFWRWRLAFWDAAGKAVGHPVESPFASVKGCATRTYTDVFRAPRGAAKLEVVLVPPARQFASSCTATDFRIAPFDDQGSVLTDWNFTSGATRSSFGHGADGSGMRTWRGEKVFETGYACFSNGFPLKEDSDYVVELERYCYPNPKFPAIVMWYLDEKGRKIKDEIPVGAIGRNGVQKFVYHAPPGTVSGRLMLYDAYLKWIKVIPVKRTHENEQKGK